MDDLKIRRKCEDMIAYGYQVLKQFPKAERHVLSQEIRTAMWSLLRLIIVCMRRKMKRMARQYHESKITLEQVSQVVMSWVGHAGHADTFRLRSRILGDIAFVPPPRRRDRIVSGQT